MQHGPEPSGGTTPFFLDGGGATGALIRRFDWSATPLGAPSRWPQPLRTLVAVMLASNQPMFVAWGPQRTFLYNEHYAPILGVKHPQALGQDFLDAWNEIRHDLRPIVEQAYGGQPVQMDDIRLLMHRHGDPEETHFSFFYSPVRDEAGAVAGLFCACTETTVQVNTQRRLQLALDAGAIIGTWVWDVGANRFLADERFARSFGLDARLCQTGLSLQQVMVSIHPEDHPRVAGAIAEALGRGGAYRCEYRVCQHDGVYRWIEANGHVERSADGTPLRFPGVLLDIEDRRRAETERDHAHALLRTIVEAVPGVVYAKDLQGRMLVANRGTAELIGKPPQDFLGRTDAEFLDDPAQARAVMANDRRIMDSGQAEQVEEPVTRPDGTPATWLSTKAPMRDAQGRVIGLVGASVDISERKRIEEQLRESDQRKSEFLAVLSHELRNPLAPIRYGLDVLDRSPPGSPQGQRAMAVIRRQSAHLARLVDDLLDVTRISRGRIELQRARLDLAELTQRVLEDFNLQAAEAGVRLLLKPAPGALWLEADATRIAQVIGNLLHNAIKFTPAGGTVALALAAEDGQAVLRVCDSGAGMAPESIAAMFEPFTQGTQGLARSRGGIGLGLPLVKGLVEMHGGSVGAHSEGAGRGAEFTVRLPLAQPAAAAAADAPAAAGGRDSHRVLLIEDNADAAAMLSQLLRLHGHDVHVASDGRAGLTLAREVAPQVVLCDLGLPDLDGYAVARALRADPQLAAVRLIALSGYAQPADRHRSRDAGFDAHLAKPADEATLLQVLG